ncbi:Potassium channel subfamily K member 9 [Frankliniella fusca]|uniref:Potassium channel subfamily K member 9 n=1 Tax=Frankliniella fusca TaxID=407009 RepID=A0AAE1HN09_9NEOP|nr:Potassium channel subfamily K member 9 [Frankliniella fusca]KAK3924492.1 Potassium channel subfamily K member 9 [Frankliniella fusca]
MRQGGRSGAHAGSMAAALHPGDLARGPGRGSVRSRGSKGSMGSKDSSSSTASDPRERVKDCCRKLVAFMCTQVGVGGLVVGYALIGAVGFRSIEIKEEYPELEEVRVRSEQTAVELWLISQELNVLNESLWRQKVDAALVGFQGAIVEAARKGYDGRTAEDMWSFPAALMFSLSIFTMIGFGNLVPRTTWGKAATVVYAVFGVPLYVLYFMNMGKVLAQTFRWLYTRLYECSTERPAGSTGPGPRVIVPSTACLWVISGYVLTGTIMFAEWEQWSYLDSCYFCVTSLCKIGFGDFVPGAATINGGHKVTKEEEEETSNQTRLVINFVYLLLGLGLIAMCYNLMREEVRVKVRQLKDDVGHCLDELHLRAATCYRGPSPEQDYMY